MSMRHWGIFKFFPVKCTGSYRKNCALLRGSHAGYTVPAYPIICRILHDNAQYTTVLIIHPFFRGCRNSGYSFSLFAAVLCFLFVLLFLGSVLIRDNSGISGMSGSSGSSRIEKSNSTSSNVNSSRLFNIASNCFASLDRNSSKELISDIRIPAGCLKIPRYSANHQT